MAKQAWHRFASAREFGDTLNKALRNEAIEFFDAERTRPRLQRATKALDDGDLQFAGEILGELEAEGHMDADIRRFAASSTTPSAARPSRNCSMRRAPVLKKRKIRWRCKNCRKRCRSSPTTPPRLSLKSKIENRRSERQIENWYRLARQHIDNHAYPHAREALQNVLQLRPKEARALQLLAEVDRQEQEYKKLRQEKEQIHQAAMDAWQKGDVSSALAKLGVVLELDRKAPDSRQPRERRPLPEFLQRSAL